MATMFIGTKALDLWATTNSPFRELWGHKFVGISRRGRWMLAMWIGDWQVSAQWKLGIKPVELDPPDGYDSWNAYWASDEGRRDAARTELAERYITAESACAAAARSARARGATDEELDAAGDRAYYETLEEISERCGWSGEPLSEHV